MNLPQTYELTPEEVRQAFSEWVSAHRLPDEPLQTVSIEIVIGPDGSATVTLNEPLPEPA